MKFTELSKENSKITLEGLKLNIENPAGTTRHGKDPGNPWSIPMRSHYGEILGTMAIDGDPLDVFIPPEGPRSDLVHVMHQRTPWTQKYDEDKIMLGYRSRHEALSEYRKHYDDPDGFVGPMTSWTLSELKEVLKKSAGEPGKLNEAAKYQWLRKKPSNIRTRG